MEQTILQVFEQGLTWPLALMLLKLMLGFFFILSIKNWITGIVARRAAFNRLKKNNYLKPGSWLSWPTTTGAVTVQVDNIYLHKVVLRTEDRNMWIHVPILSFAASSVAFYETKPAA